jgi:hypothetical protein
MKSVATQDFWDLFESLPAEAQGLAVKTYSLWRENPRHPSLQFRPLRAHRDRYTVRIVARYRALARVEGEIVTWVWIGTHEEYNRALRKP